MTQITDYIYLGSIVETSEKFLKDNKIELILNFARECEYDSDIKQLHFKFDDNYQQDLLGNFNWIVDIVKTHVSNKKNVLIHCFVGKSRSVSFVLAYLMKEQHMNLQDALKYVSDKRDVCPNVSFMTQLMEYEKIVFGLEHSPFNYDDYVIGFISNVSNKNKDVVSEIYYRLEKDFDKTFDELFQM